MNAKKSRKRKSELEELESIDMPSQEDITARRQEYIAIAKQMNPYASQQIDRFVEMINKEGHLHIWLYKNLYPCRINRNQNGDWCGYVGIPHGHPCHGMHYDKADEKFDIYVHGGLTFSERVHNWGKDNFWFFGFDCGHAWDINIMNIAWANRFGDILYKDKEYAINETNELARQLEEIEQKKKEH